MKSRYLPFGILIIVIFAVSFAGCKSKTENIVEAKQITGEIIKTGSMPFTNLTIKVSETEGYILECPEEIEKELNKNQGETYTLEYSQEKTVKNRKVLVIDKILSKKEIIK